MQRSLAIAVGAVLAVSTARAQAPGSGPVVLLLPASPRAAALGNAGAAWRDEYAIFYNPAQLVPSTSIGASFARYDWNGTTGAIASAVTVGTLTYGWGVEVAEFTARGDAAYPFDSDALMRRGTRNALSLVAGGGASYLLKGFRTGVGIKFAEDRVDGSPTAGVASLPILHGVLLGDVGMSHALWSGTAALVVQNIGDHSRLRLPTQTTLGWARQKQAGEFDLGFNAQVVERNMWIGVGGGIEADYGWIEGWSVAARAGARRPETIAQRPVTMGGSVNADRLQLDYALELFEHGTHAHHIAIRWR